MLAAGVDVAEERKGLDLVVLDADRRVVLSRGALSVDGACEEILRLDPAVVCIDSPSGWSMSGRSRRAERDIRRLGISAFATGPDPGDHPFYNWVRVGITVFERLAETYPLYRGGPLYGGAPHRHAAEVFPAATAALLAAERRPNDVTKNAFRRHVLRGEGVEESVLPNIDRVDAALAALTGICALEGGGGSWLGDPDEGALLLPTASLPLTPLPRRPTAGRPG